MESPRYPKLPSGTYTDGTAQILHHTHTGNAHGHGAALQSSLMFIPSASRSGSSFAYYLPFHASSSPSQPQSSSSNGDAAAYASEWRTIAAPSTATVNSWHFISTVID